MYKIISHRGNLHGPNPTLENKPTYIEETIKLGYDVEIDVWYKNGWYLGHNYPQYKVTRKWLMDHAYGLWIHCKNLDALYAFVSKDNHIGISSPNYFWHQEDDFTLTSHGFIWTYPNKQLTRLSICVLPERGYKGSLDKCYGICTDFTYKYDTQRH